VDFEDVTPSGSAGTGTPVSASIGYCIGNIGSTHTWDGRLAQVQVFNRRLSSSEMDSALRSPGSIKNGLRLWLPMTNRGDLNDRSGNEFDGTRTDTETGNDRPPYDTLVNFGSELFNETVGQIVIPSNGSEPAIGVRGLGTQSKLTASSLLYGNDRLITTADWLDGGVIEPTVRDLYLDGNQGVSNHPFGPPETALTGPICHAIDIDGDAAEVTGCKIFDFRGNAITVRKTIAPETSPLVRMSRIRDNKISHCWTGILAGAVDTQIDGNRIANVRDYGIRETAGSIQCSNNHVFGALVGIQFEGGPSRSIGDRFSDCPIGFKVLSGASGTHIADGTTEHCWHKNMHIEAERVRISNTRILVQNTSDEHPGLNNSGITSIVGLHLTNYATQSLVTDCDVEVGAYTFGEGTENEDTNLRGSTGVLIEANNVTIDNLKMIGSDRDHEIGVRVSPSRQGGDFFIDARGGGFNEANDCVVKFDTPGMGQNHGTGQRWYILHAPGDFPVRISSGWGSTLKIFTRSESEDEWTELETGGEYPPPQP
jgi:hypothetical protein